MAAVIRGTGKHDGHGDVGQVNILHLDGERISAVRTCFSDIDSVDRYLA